MNSGIIVQNTVNIICKPFFFAISCAPSFSGIVSFSSFVGAVVLDMNHYQRLLVRLSKVENPSWNPYWIHIVECDRTDRPTNQPTVRPSFRFITCNAAPKLVPTWDEFHAFLCTVYLHMFVHVWMALTRSDNCPMCLMQKWIMLNTHTLHVQIHIHCM